MIELIKEIPGPTFLFYYILFAVFIVFFGKIYAVNDYTRNLEVPDPALLEPLDMALLTKGVDGAIKVTVFNLWKKQIIDFNQVPNKVKQMKLLSDVYGLNDIEKKVLKKARRRYLFTLDLKSKVKLIKLSSDVDGLSEIENRNCTLYDEELSLVIDHRYCKENICRMLNVIEESLNNEK